MKGGYWKGKALYIDLRKYGGGRPVFGKLKKDTAEARRKLESKATTHLQEVERLQGTGMLFENMVKKFPTYIQAARFFWDKYWSQKEYFLDGTTRPDSDYSKLQFGIEFLGHMHVDEIKRSDIKRFRMHLRENHPSWAGAYVNRIIAMVGQVYRFCITQEVYRFERADRTARQRYGKIDCMTDLANPGHGLPRLPENPQDTMVISIGQFRTLWEIMAGEYRHYALIAAHTGFRKRNITRLRIDEVDMINQTFRLRSHKGKAPIVHTMHADLISLFKSLVPYNDEHWFSGHFSYRQWRKYAEKAGVPGFMPFRGMRASYTTWRVEEGASISILEAALGHSTPVITQKHYNKAYEASKLLIENQRSVVNG